MIAPRVYRSLQGDMLDAIAHRLMGGAEHVVALMEVNRHVAGLPAILPAGLDLAIPVVVAGDAAIVAPIRLWGRG